MSGRGVPNPDDQGPLDDLAARMRRVRDEVRDAKGDYTEFGFRELDAKDPIDEYLDGDLSREDRRFRQAMIGDRGFLDRLEKTEDALSELRRPLWSPDFSKSILDRVHRATPYEPPARQRMVTVGRLAIAASVLLGVGVLSVVEYVRPGTTRIGNQPALVSGFVNATRADALVGSRNFAQAMREASGSMLPVGSGQSFGTVVSFEVRDLEARPGRMVRVAAPDGFAVLRRPGAASGVSIAELPAPTLRPLADPAAGSARAWALADGRDERQGVAFGAWAASRPNPGEWLAGGLVAPVSPVPAGKR